MAHRGVSHGRFDKLRRQAEAFLDHEGPTDEQVHHDARVLVHELHVTQVELELQNDELQRSQEELAAARDEFSDLFDLAPVGYLTLTSAGMIARANQEAAALLGFRDAMEVAGGLFTKLLVTDEGRRSYYGWRRESWEECHGEPLELPMLRADGTKFVASLRARRRGTDLWLTLEDVTERHEAERRRVMTTRILRCLNRERRVEDAVAEVCDVLRQGMGVYGVGIRLRRGEDYPYHATSGLPQELVQAENSLLIDAPEGTGGEAPGNPSLVGLCGVVLRRETDPVVAGCSPGGSFFANSADELQGAVSHHRCDHPAARHCLDAGYQSVALVPIPSAERVVGLLQLIDPRPGLLDADRIAVLENLGVNIGMAWAKQRAEEQRRALELRMLQVQKLESLGVLVGGIAHDFNNLLTPITGNAQLALLDLESNSTSRPLVQEILGAGRDAAQLIQRLLVYAGHAPIDVRPVDLCGLLEQMCSLLAHSVPKSVTVLCLMTPERPTVQADAAQLRQIVMNLVLNAAEALGDEPGEIQIETGLCSVDEDCLDRLEPGLTLAPGPCAFVRVHDDGPGMDQETRGKIFDPFFSTKFVGRGLGLAAVRGIVAAHQGALRVESQPSQGSTFTVFLPATDASPLPEPAEPILLGEQRRTATVLAVDDDPGVLMFFVGALERGGYRVLEASGGRQAVGLYEAHQDEIDCVLLDHTMPDLNGEQTLEQLKKLRPDVRAILCSGHGPDFLAQRRTALGLAGILPKPCGVSELLQTLDEVLGQ